MNPYQDGSFGVNSSDMFDSISHTQGGLPHLVQFLWDEYKKHLQSLIDDRKEKGQPTVDLTTAAKKAPATNFCEWATAYLKENRIVQSFFIDGNLGVQLTNMKSLAVCPGLDEIRGTMQESQAVAITQGKSQADNNGVVDETSKAFRI